MARRRIHPTQKSENGQSEPLHIPLDLPRIITTALTLLQAEGLEPITMRKIADSLGVKAASLYYHVKDKEQLLHLLAEKISSEVEMPIDAMDWRVQLTQWATNFRHVLGQYRDAVKIMNATISATPQRLSHIEFLFRVFTEEGFHPPQIPWLASMLKNYVFSFVDEEHRHMARAERELADLEQMGKNQAVKFQALSGANYPHVIQLAEYTTSVDMDQEFQYGIQVLLDGFEAQLARAQD
ncbi:TetR/AcrR family transcriptional regulator C-terminal domain-containing protein [Paenibacillus sp. MDMC362]|uniref:TetR/AcrR family transcriptional regulator C-terminal domain-containing protein n=1 Tax=Paenibacillus sp. MDMC362 TaxID=2977365 RepID=UPI000DC5A585|nr:TetR/AcrR family transcriptional regulator C-terminal domain-containing protein [Paenibacillus sp. MDMC362]RAR41283.1 TetR/AcrR family transcriptional regulator [Paenibacillus sp. MDMC362]